MGKNAISKFFSFDSETAKLLGYYLDSEAPVEKDIRIVVMQAGFVMVGEYTRKMFRGVVRIENARVIRRYGTQRGLAQLAIEGTLSETILEDAGTVEAPWHAVVFTIRCTHPSWFV